MTAAMRKRVFGLPNEDPGAKQDHDIQDERVGTKEVRFLNQWLDRNQQATAVLALVAAASTLSLLVFFVLPFSLLDLYDRPLLDLYKLSLTDPPARWWVLAGYMILGALYWLGWRAAQRAWGRAAWGVVLGGALASATLLLFLYPFGAADIFDNIMHGRILGVYGANPFQDVANQFSNDLSFAYVAWRRSPSAYGPAWELLAGGVAWLVQETLGVSETPRVAPIIANVLAFKLIGGVFLAACVAVVIVILRRKAPERALAGVVLLAWNPVVLVETVGHGHNDIAMVFWVLAAAWGLVERRYTLAILALVTGALVKFVPVLMLPVALAIAWRELGTGGQRARGPEGQRSEGESARDGGAEDQLRVKGYVSRFAPRLRFLLITGLASIALVVIVYAPFWQGLETLNIERKQALFTSSLPAAAWAILQGPWGQEVAGRRISLFAAAMTAFFALWQAGWAWREQNWLSFPRAAFRILMFYLLITSLWFQSWYAIWPLALAALLPPGHEARLAVLFSYAALAKPLLFEPLLLWQRPLPPKAWRELRLGPAVMLLPWLYVFYALLQQRIPRRPFSREG